MQEDYTVSTNNELLSPFRFTKDKALELAQNMNSFTKTKLHTPFLIEPTELNYFIPYRSGMNLPDVLEVINAS